MAAYAVSFFLPLLVSSTALVVRYNGHFYFPVLRYYPAVTFGQQAFGEPDYRALAATLRGQHQGNWALMPLYPYSPTESLLDLPGSPPNAPSRQHIFGTDDRGRDIFVRLAYGFNVSLSFALLVLGISLGIGVSDGSDRWDISPAKSIWWASGSSKSGLRCRSSTPSLLSAPSSCRFTFPDRNLVLQPSFWLLIAILTAFDWMGITYYIRGEVYREKAKDYVAAGHFHRGLRPRHHRQAHPAELTHAGGFFCAIHGRWQHRRSGSAGFSWVRPAGADAELGRA